MGLPMGRPFFNQVRLGGGIPVASQAKETGLLMVSTTPSCAGPSILGGTEEREIFNIALRIKSLVSTHVSWIFWFITASYINHTSILDYHGCSSGSSCLLVRQHWWPCRRTGPYQTPAGKRHVSILIPTLFCLWIRGIFFKILTRKQIYQVSSAVDETKNSMQRK